MSKSFRNQRTEDRFIAEKSRKKDKEKSLRNYSPRDAIRLSENDDVFDEYGQFEKIRGR